MKQILILILSSTISVTMNAQTLQGNHWTAKRVEGAYIVSIENRASILDALTGFITSQKFKPDKLPASEPLTRLLYASLTPAVRNMSTRLSMNKWKFLTCLETFPRPTASCCRICILHSAGRTTLPWLDTYWKLKFAELPNSSFTP